MSKPMIGDKPLTNAEKQARWRSRRKDRDQSIRELVLQAHELAYYGEADEELRLVLVKLEKLVAE